MPVRPLDSLLAKLRLRQLALVAAIADTGSVRAAAPRIHVTQPAATKMLRELELQFGAPLFVRAASGMAVTELGEAVTRYAREVVGELGRLRDDAAAIQLGTAGKVALGCTLAAVPQVLAPAIASWLQGREGATVSVQVDTSDVLLPQVLEGKLDLLIGRAYPGAGHLVHFERLDAVALEVVVGPDHPVRGLRSVSRATLARWPWILPPVGNLLRGAIDSAFRNDNLEPPRVAVETTSTVLSLALLQSTQMVSVLPGTLARDHERKGVLARVRAPLLDPGPFGLIWRQGRLLSPLALALCDALHAAAGRQRPASKAGKRSIVLA